MDKLKKEFQAKQNTYKQLEEGENFYLYGVWNLKDEAKGKPSYYEIFEKKIVPAVTIKGVFYPEREIYPKDEDFGSWGWCSNSIEQCNFIKEEMSLF